MPSWELFNRKDIAYRRSVFTAGVPIMSIEALSTMGWERYAHLPIGLDTFGLSGPYKEVYGALGFLPEVIAAKALELKNFYRERPVPDLLEKPFHLLL